MAAAFSSSLKIPTDTAHLSAAEALGYSAIELFNERAAAAVDGFVLSDAEVPAVLEICRRLDGMPLALELAAAQVEVFGIKGLAAHLEDCLTVLTRGRRTALPRHQTLRAAIDWSYNLLPAPEQTVLRRAAVFTGDFPIDAASEVCAGEGLTKADVFEAVANLSAKSLIVTDISGDTIHHRLLDTTRAYAFEKLAISGELERVRRLHAEAQRDLFQRADAEVAAGATDEWRAKYGSQVGNLRSALAWAFSLDGDVEGSASRACTQAATDFWIAMSLLGECCDWAVRAIAQLGAAKGTSDEMALQWGLGQALTYSKGMRPDAQAALTRALTLAEGSTNLDYQLRTAFGLWLFAVRGGDFRDSLALARKTKRIAEATGDPADNGIADWTLGVSRFCLGEHTEAAFHYRRAHAAYPTTRRSRDVVRLGMDVALCGRCYEAMTMWSLGFPEEAARAGQDAIDEARMVNHPMSLCFALAVPCSIVLVKMGDLTAAERCIDELIDESVDKQSLATYEAFGMCAKGSLRAVRGDVVSGEQCLSSGLARMRETGFYFYYTFFQAEHAAVLGCCGRVDESLAEIDAAERHTEESGSLWCMPEVLRIKGELLVKHVGAAETAVEQSFLQSLDWARRQEALSWELSTATSLARFWRDRDRKSQRRANSSAGCTAGSLRVSGPLTFSRQGNCCGS